MVSVSTGYLVYSSENIYIPKQKKLTSGKMIVQSEMDSWMYIQCWVTTLLESAMAHSQCNIPNINVPVVIANKFVSYGSDGIYMVVKSIINIKQVPGNGKKKITYS